MKICPDNIHIIIKSVKQCLEIASKLNSQVTVRIILCTSSTTLFGATLVQTGTPKSSKNCSNRGEQIAKNVYTNSQNSNNIPHVWFN